MSTCTMAIKSKTEARHRHWGGDPRGHPRMDKALASTGRAPAM